MDEIPANPIDSSNLNSNFSPIKFVEKVPLSELVEKEPSDDLKNLIEKRAEFCGIVDDEITISAITAKIQDDKFIGKDEVEFKKETRNLDIDNNNINDNNMNFDNNILHDDKIDDTVLERLHRKSDEELCNTPKRERHQDRPVHERSEKYELTPSSPSRRAEIVKSLSKEFEKRMASIQVSPKPEKQSSTGSPPVQMMNAPSASRVMSPIRCVAQLSPVPKLNFNDDQSGSSIETPKLVSPSKIVAAASVNALDSEKILKEELEAKVECFWWDGPFFKWSIYFFLFALLLH